MLRNCISCGQQYQFGTKGKCKPCYNREYAREYYRKTRFRVVEDETLFTKLRRFQCDDCFHRFESSLHRLDVICTSCGGIHVSMQPRTLQEIVDDLPLADKLTVIQAINSHSCHVTEITQITVQS